MFEYDGCTVAMPPRISAFPKCYLDEIAATRTMSVFEWVDMAKDLDADGLEMYEGFFTSLDSAYLAKVHDAIHTAGFEMPMLCCSPDFTSPLPDARKQAVEHEAAMIRVARQLGGPTASPTAVSLAGPKPAHWIAPRCLPEVQRRQFAFNATLLTLLCCPPTWMEMPLRRPAHPTTRWI